MTNVFWIYNDSHMRNVKKVIVFGAGSGLERVYAYLKNKGVEILCICDNDSQKEGRRHDGIKVELPEDIKRFDSKTPIVIASYYFNEIYEQLTRDFDFRSIYWGMENITGEVQKKIDDRRFTVKRNNEEEEVENKRKTLPCDFFEKESHGFKTEKGKISSIFFHWLPKTGGRSFQEIVTKSSSNKVSFVYLKHLNGHYVLDNPLHECDELICADHNVYPIISTMDFKSKFFTILRDPVDRLISEFYYGCSHIDDPDLFIEETDRKNKFEDLVKKAPHLNYYCSVFSGKMPQKHICKHSYVSEITEESVTETEYRTAFNNLEKDFFFIGVFEEYEKTLFSFFDMMEWSYIQPVPHHYHKTVFRPQKTDFNENILKLLAKKTYYDQKLYDFYKERFLVQSPKDFGAELIDFQDENNRS